MNLLKNLSVPKILKVNSFTTKKVFFSRIRSDSFQHCRTLVTWKGNSPFNSTTIRLRRYSTAEENAAVEDVLGNEEHFSGDGGNTEKIFEKIAAGDPTILKALKLLEMEVTLVRQGDGRVPEIMKEGHWRGLLEINSRSRRKKYLSFLRLNELKTIAAKKKSSAKREIALKKIEDKGSGYYGISGHTMFMRIYEQDINRLLDHRLCNSDLDIVFDCSYEEYMSNFNTKACVKQILLCINATRLGRYPCNLKFCNLNREGHLGQLLELGDPGFFKDRFFETHSESYLDLFPKEKLVYLTPHCQNELVTFSHDNIYIIGAFVDKGTSVKASLAKAKRDNIRMAKFPIDNFLFWKQGTKSLPLNIVLSILIDMGFYNDWKKAFKNIPRRCTLE